MKKNAWMLMSLFILGVVVSGCSKRNESFEIDEPVDFLMINSESGNIDVTSGPSETINVDAVIRGDETVIDHEVRDGVLHIRTNCDDAGLICSVDYTVTVPEQLEVVLDSGSGNVSLEGTIGNAQLESGSGNVSVEDVSGSATLSSGSGNVEARGVFGDEVSLTTGSGNTIAHDIAAYEVSLTTDSGNVEGGSLAIKELYSETGSGNIELGFCAAPLSVDAETGSGNIELAVPEDSYTLHTYSGSGDVEVSGITVNDDMPQQIRAETGSGNIIVRGF